MNNLIKDVSTGNIYLMSDLINGKKTTVNSCGLSPLSGVIICPETGRPLNLVELFLGERVFVDSIQYDMHPIPGIVKSPNGEYVNLVELILNSGGESQGSGDWVIKRMNAEEKIKPLLFDAKTFSDKCIVSVLLYGKKYFFTKDEEILFDKEDVFTFNGSSSDNTDTNKFCNIGILSDETSLEGVGFEEGYVYTCTLKNSENNYVFNETIKEVY